MNRRNLLQAMAGGAVAARHLAADERVARATRATPSPRIQDVQVIATKPDHVRLVVVKIITDQDGRHGYGCATFTQRAELVMAAVEKYLKPFLLGRPADRIEDLWQAMYSSSYWRNGPVLNNAISGVDQALWDIKGKQCGLPVYQLLGGKCREAVACYAHASGGDTARAVESARHLMGLGFRHVRVQIGVPGMAGYGAGEAAAKVERLHDDPVFEPEAYLSRVVQLFETCRQQLGGEVELLHDVHERVSPIQAVRLAKALEPYRLFFLEDPLSPEDLDWFRMIRQQSATPIAMGELFNSPHEWTPLISQRLIDYIRVHITQAGGLTPCRKIAAMGEIFGVRTAWHGPGDVSPIGHAANVALDLACYNFGIQEYTHFSDVMHEVFPGTLVHKEGYLYANEAPGWGIEVNEAEAKKYPYGYGEGGGRGKYNGGWGIVRRRDGTVIKQ
jgi:mannonate dehydratase